MAVVQLVLIDKPPKFRFAVYSVKLGEKKAELESSWGYKWEAQSAFKNAYSNWGLEDTTFYLLDWETQETLDMFTHVAVPARS